MRSDVASAAAAAAAAQVSVTMTPNLFAGKLESFSQTLDLSMATVAVDAKTATGDEVSFSIYVDAASDTIQVRKLKLIKRLLYGCCLLSIDTSRVTSHNLAHAWSRGPTALAFV
jgi:hypothetical protein